ncbi:unnamed protein product [Ceutorhynchus assimilis]|uniref:Angiotensin-converting enzyme n=1 Tax=Ceutorhynchus assimilis TaxID=467358 RepID=A0A9N9QLR4_9CUCU|nr:unnamed protein product [Ceutorhynchus assimilis]
MCFRVSSAQWAYSTNMTDFNKRRMIEEQTLKAKFDKVSWRKATEFDWTRMPDPTVRRQLRMLATKDRVALSDEKYNEIHHLISEMKDAYAHVRICDAAASRCDFDLTDAQRFMAQTRDAASLRHTWLQWHDAIGPRVRNKFMRYVDLANQAARLNGFSDASEAADTVYEDARLQDELAQTFGRILPLYKELFAYVRSKLYVAYGPDVVRIDGPLPAHLLGNMWAQEWSRIYDLVVPYPEFDKFDVTGELLRQGYTPLRIFQMAEEFYTSLGLKPMPPEFWRSSMLERPKSREAQCTASAWDFCNRIDYRIKQCTEVDMENFATAHHEMAHIEYYLHYSEQPFLFRDGANPGFHEGFANSILLSVVNPTHLYRVGLMNSNGSETSYEQNINFLMLQGLRKIAYAPFAYMMDQWRHLVFGSPDGVARMNSDWWSLRLRLQGIVPPSRRPENGFDAASKRHVPFDIPYVQYYVALLVEFQIFKSACRATDHRGPLHLCDIYRSREAGRILSEVLRMGKARHWKEVLAVLSRGGADGELSAEPLLEYFEPLFDWLRTANRKEPVIGWMSKREDFALYRPLVGATGARIWMNYRFLFVLFVIFFII